MDNELPIGLAFSKKLKANKNVVFITSLFILLCAVQLFSHVPYYTYTVGVEQHLVRVQDGYEPVKKLHFETGTLTDLFIKNDTLYLSDTDNGLIYVLKKNEETFEYEIVKTIGEGELLSVSGIFVDDTGNIYVADSWAQSVLKFSSDGELVLTITRPDSPIYGKTNDFIPLKVVADKRGNIYALCQGLTNGLAVFNRDGKFLSFFGANEPKVSLRMILQRLVFTESQKAQLLKIRPPSPTSIAADEFGSIWTVTQGLYEDAIKRFNVAGTNIYPSVSFSSENFIDLDVDKFGNAYALSTNGLIYVYDVFGNLIFIFGGQSFYENRLGLFRTPIALSISEKGELFILDKEDSSITQLRRTKFGSLVFKGLELYNQGIYLESEKIWNEILKMSSMFVLAYKVLGTVEFKKGIYSKAFEYFKIAQDSKGYSEAFWYLRNEWLQKNVGWIFLTIVILASLDIVKTILARQGIIKKKERQKNKRKGIIQEQIYHSLLFLKNPFDAVYEMKKKNRISILTGIILYALMYVENIIIRLVGSPLFFGFDAKKINFSNLFFDTYRLLFLFIISNYLISELSDAEGRFKDIFIGTIGSFLPYLVFSVPIAVITNFLTLNESFIYTFSMQIIWIWSLVLLIIVIAQMHNFSFSETIKNILLTIFTMFLLTVLIIIISVIFKEEISFFTAFFEELIFRAKTR